MRISFLILAISVLAFSCKPKDKQAELDGLKKQYAALGEKIAQIEAEITAKSGVNTDKLPLVGVQEVKTQEFKHYIEVQGKIDGDENVVVSAQSMGILKSVTVKQGDVVRKGQVLGEIDDELLKKNLATLNTQLELQSKIYDKQKALWDQKVGSEVQYLQAKTGKEGLENNIASLKEQMKMSKLLSPIDGTVEDISVKVGQAVSPGPALMRIVNFSKIKIVAEVAEAYSAKVQKGNQVNIFFPDLGKQITGNIDFASKFINPINRTFQAEIRFAGAGGDYRANMVAVVKINDYSSANAVAVPINAIQTDSKGKYVYTLETKNNANTVHKNHIEIGRDYNGLIEILSGLKAGDKIVTVGYQNIDEGMGVKL